MEIIGKGKPQIAKEKKRKEKYCFIFLEKMVFYYIPLVICH